MSSGELRDGAPTARPSSRHGVSVVVPSFRGPAALERTLRSITVQTVDPRRSEVIVVVNGPAVADRDSFEDLRRDLTPTQIRYLFTATAGASLAWNLGVQAARMEWLTFLDDDDTITPNYLESLLRLAEPGVVPLAEIHDHHPDGTLDTETALNRTIRRHAGTTVSASALPQGLGFNAAKLVPTRWAQLESYDRRMTNGQDVAFFGTISLRHDVMFSVVEADSGAAYVRGLSDASMSRQVASYEFSVEHRLHVIERLDRARRGAPRGRRSAADHLVRAQVHQINRFLVEHPARRRDVVASVASRDLRWFPYRDLNRDLAPMLVAVPDGTTVRRRVATALRRCVAESDAPVDVVAVASQPPSRSWIVDFWRSSGLRHLEGRLIQVRPPATDAAHPLAEAVGPTARYQRVVSLTRAFRL